MIFDVSFAFDGRPLSWTPCLGTNWLCSMSLLSLSSSNRQAAGRFLEMHCKRSHLMEGLVAAANDFLD
jgi:hypothetical protein